MNTKKGSEEGHGRMDSGRAGRKLAGGNLTNKMGRGKRGGLRVESMEERREKKGRQRDSKKNGRR